MPQLDVLIIIPQVVWLFFGFILLYFSLTFLILPNFLKAIKIRKLILLQNQSFNNDLLVTFSNRHKSLVNKINYDLKNIKSNILDKIFVSKFIFRKKKKFFFTDFVKITNYLKIASIQIIYYCNINSLNSIKFYPTLINWKNKI